MSGSIDVDIQVFCECGEELDVIDIDSSSPYHIKVSKCTTCIDEAFESGKEEERKHPDGS